MNNLFLRQCHRNTLSWGQGYRFFWSMLLWRMYWRRVFKTGSLERRVTNSQIQTFESSHPLEENYDWSALNGVGNEEIRFKTGVLCIASYGLYLWVEIGKLNQKRVVSVEKSNYGRIFLIVRLSPVPLGLNFQYHLKVDRERLFFSRDRFYWISQVFRPARYLRFRSAKFRWMFDPTLW